MPPFRVVAAAYIDTMLRPCLRFDAATLRPAPRPLAAMPMLPPPELSLIRRRLLRFDYRRDFFIEMLRHYADFIYY